MRVLISIVTLVLIPFVMLSKQSQSAPLKIVVLEGEGGVNIIQQKTPCDRGGGQSAAFAGGVQTLTVTTNAAGQASSIRPQRDQRRRVLQRIDRHDGDAIAMK